MTSATAAREQFLTNADRFEAVLADPGSWGAPSACAEWSAGEVVDHVIDTQRDLMAREGFDLGERPTGSPAEAWRDHAAVLRGQLDDAVWAHAYDGFFGPTTLGETLGNYYGFDLLVHGWDIGSGWGRPPAWTDVEMDQVEASADSFGDNLYVEGVCREAIDVPDDASRQTRLLARLGRRG
jgi:uncharacterized protein (TIGR03086 family)